MAKVTLVSWTNKPLQVITMPKAILELEMPESCRACKLGHYDELYGLTHCDILRECMPYAGRRPDCLLTDKDEYLKRHYY